MFYFKPRVALAVLGLVFSPLALHAQKLEVGKWTGTVIVPDDPPVDVTYDVAMAGDTVQITLVAPQHGSFPLTDIKVEAKKVSFAFTPGPRVICVLNQKDDGTYAGQCIPDEGGDPASITMIPPKKENKAG